MHSGHGTGMKGLHQKRSHPGNNHRNASVDMPDRRVGTKQAFIIPFAHGFNPIGFAMGIARQHGEKL